MGAELEEKIHLKPIQLFIFLPVDNFNNVVAPLHTFQNFDFGHVGLLNVVRAAVAQLDGFCFNEHPFEGVSGGSEH